MLPHAHSSEFTRLVAVWLDETATPEDAAQLWRAVAASADCALAFAAAARFDALLAQTVRERAGEQMAMRQMVTGAVLAQPAATRPAPMWLTEKTALRVAAVAAVLGLGAWFFWPVTEAPEMAQAPDAQPQAPGRTVERTPPPSQLASPSVRRLPMVSPQAIAAQASSEGPLLDRLDRFFLAGLALDQVPLREALGILQGQLQELNFLRAESLDALRITVPADAAGRRITFHTGPIAFLKAVRAIAALGGCEVTLDEPVLALILRREIFPQVPERRDLRHLLAGRFNSDGTDASGDASRVAALLADAAALGIAIDPAVPLADQDPLPMTRGQWAALELLTATRDQIGQLPLPAYQLYSTEDEPNEPDRVIDGQAVTEIRNEFQRRGAEPVAVSLSIAPSIAMPNQPAMLPPLSVQPLGEGTQVTVVLPTPPVEIAARTGREPSTEIVAGVLLPGQGLTFSAASDSIASFSNASGASGQSVGRTQFVLLPVTNPTPP